MKFVHDNKFILAESIISIYFKKKSQSRILQKT